MDTQPGGRDRDPQAVPGQQADGDPRRTQLGWRLPADPAAQAIPPERPGTRETQLRDPGTRETQLRDPRAGETQLRDPGTRETQLPSGDARPPEGVVRRFGPGVTAAPQWAGAGTQQPPARRRQSARRGVLLALVAVAAVVAYLLLWHPDPVAVTGAEVAPAAQPGQACNVTVDVVGTIHTNGKSGTIQYRWLRSDGESIGPLTQTAEEGQPVVQVHLLWTLSGRGRYPASATLEISAPQPMSATGGFTYSCR